MFSPIPVPILCTCLCMHTSSHLNLGSPVLYWASHQIDAKRRSLSFSFLFYILSSFPRHTGVSALFARSPTRILMSCQKIIAAAVSVSIMELASCPVCTGIAHLRDTSCGTRNGVTIPFHRSSSAATNHSSLYSGPHSLSIMPTFITTGG